MKMKAGTATTTTHAPSVNLVARKMIVAAAVATAPVAFTIARRRQRGGRSPAPVDHQPALGQRKPGEHTNSKKWDQPFGIAVDGDEQDRRHHGQGPMPLPNT